jgi:hypothetical protein
MGRGGVLGWDIAKGQNNLGYEKKICNKKFLSKKILKKFLKNLLHNIVTKRVRHIFFR